MNEFEVTRVYPVIDDDPDLLYEEIKTIGFQFSPLAENKLVPPGVGDLVSINELYGYNEELNTYGLRDVIVEIAKDYGFPNEKIEVDMKSCFDKKIG